MQTAKNGGITAGLPLGGAVSAALLPFLATTYGWRSAFLGGGFVALFGAIIFMVFYRDKIIQIKNNEQKKSIRASIKSKFSMIYEPSMINIILSGICLTAVQYGVSIFLSLYLHESFDVDIQIASEMLFLVLICGVFGRIILASWSDRCKSGRYFPVIICLISVSMGLLALMLLPLTGLNNYYLFLLMLWIGFFGYGWYGPWVAYIADTAPIGKTGFALGLAMTTNQIAVVIITPMLGILKDVSGNYIYGWSILFAITIVTFLSTYLRRSRSDLP